MFFANGKINDGIEVMFHENVDLEARDSQTDKNIGK